MTNPIFDDIEALYTKAKSLFASEQVIAEQKLSDLRTKYQPAFDAWLVKMAKIGETQGMTILEQGLTDVTTVVMAGGNPSVAIAALVPQVESQVMADLKTDENIVRADAKNTTYTAIGLALASLPSPTATPIPESPVAVTEPPAA